MAVQTISCRSGNIFSACIVEESNSPDVVDEVEYYKEQGCVIENKEDGDWKFSHCECEHCITINHNYIPNI